MTTNEMNEYEHWIEMMFEDAIAGFRSTERNQIFQMRWARFEEKLSSGGGEGLSDEMFRYWKDLMDSQKEECFFVYSKGLRDCSAMLRRLGVFE